MTLLFRSALGAPSKLHALHCACYQTTAASRKRAKADQPIPVTSKSPAIQTNDGANVPRKKHLSSSGPRLREPGGRSSRKKQQPHITAVDSQQTRSVCDNSSPAEIVRNHRDKIRKLTATLEAMERKRKEQHAIFVARTKRLVALIQRDLCRREEHSVLAPLLQGAQLVPVGSLATGLTHGSTSDIDLCFVFDYGNVDISFLKKRCTQRRVLVNKMAERLRNLEGDRLIHVDRVPFARVPLVIGHFGDLSVDIQMPSDDQSVRNSNLIKHYVAIDKRFAELYNWLRSVSVSFGIKNSKWHLLSSYHIIMLVVHFLQSKQGWIGYKKADSQSGNEGAPCPVLPVLHQSRPELVGRHLPIRMVIDMLGRPVRDIGWKSINRKSSGELAVEMAHYYAGFDFARFDIDIGTGELSDTKQSSRRTPFCIFDPYSDDSVTRSDHLASAFSSAMRFALTTMQSGRMLDNFPNIDQEAEEFREQAVKARWRKFLLPPPRTQS